MTKPAFPEVIDSTFLSTFKTCEQKSYYQSFRHLHPTAKSIHLHAGGVFAKGLETARLLYYARGIPQDRAIDLAAIAMIKEWGSELTPMFSWQQGADNSPKYLDRLIQALSFYFEQWPMATDLIQPYATGDGPAVEFSFAIPLPINHPTTGNPILFAGRFDMLGIYRDKLWVVDEKTTKQLGPSWANQWKMRGQLTAYCWSAQQHNLPVVGAIIRGISFKKYDFGAMEVPTYRSQHMIEDWYQSTLETIQRAKTAWERDYWLRDLSDACNAYGGCPFQLVCCSNDPERWLNAHYVTRVWNPLHKD